MILICPMFPAVPMFPFPCLLPLCGRETLPKKCTRPGMVKTPGFPSSKDIVNIESPIDPVIILHCHAPGGRIPPLLSFHSFKLSSKAVSSKAFKIGALEGIARAGMTPFWFTPGARIIIVVVVVVVNVVLESLLVDLVGFIIIALRFSALLVFVSFLLSLGSAPGLVVGLVAAGVNELSPSAQFGKVESADSVFAVAVIGADAARLVSFRASADVFLFALEEGGCSLLGPRDLADSRLVLVEDVSDVADGDTPQRENIHPPTFFPIPGPDGADEPDVERCSTTPARTSWL